MSFKAEIKNVKVGDKIKFYRKPGQTEFAEDYIAQQDGKVIAIYPHHVLIQCKNWKQSVCLGTLVEMGLEYGGGSMFDKDFERGVQLWRKE